MNIFNLPDLGEGLPDAEINEWHVTEGDVVKTDEPLVSMETAKAVVDVPAPRNGRIVKLFGKPGDIIKTGHPLVEFADENAPIAEKPSTSSTVVGSLTVGDTVIEENATGIIPQRSEASVKAIPAVRALAKKLHVDLENVIPTGPNGQITQEDVKKAHEMGGVSHVTETNAIVEPVRGVRRAMANAMAQSHAEVAPVTLVDDADIEAWPKGTDITYRVIRALVTGCKAESALNAHFDYKKLERRVFHEVNLGIAMDSPEGLFVPVIKAADKQNQSSIRETLERFKEEVRNRTIPQEDLKGSTIQLSNFGTFAGRYANPIIVPPIVAILGTGKIKQEVVAFEGEMAIHRILPLSLTIDHRAVTGGEAARFLAAVIADLEQTD